MQYVQLNKMISEPCTPRHKRKLFSLKCSFGYAMRKPHRDKNLQYSKKSKSGDYKERPVDEKYRKVFVTAHVVLRTAAMFLTG